MLRLIIGFSILVTASLVEAAEPPRVWLDTSHGPIVIELNDSAAPLTTDRFLGHVDAGFYDGMVFHRSIDGFMIQSGGFDRDWQPRESPFGTLPSERNNGLGNMPGTIAMALRGGDVDSGQNEFFINLDNNDFLDEDFTVFGEVIHGLATVERINALPTGAKAISQQIQFQDAPMASPFIHRAVRTSGFPILPAHAGSWFDPDNSGFGFNIEIAEDENNDDGATALVYWYDYRADEQAWFIGIEPFDHGTSELTLDMLSWDGQSPVDFQSPPAEVVPAGTLTIEFTGCASARFDYDLAEDGAGELSISRLTLAEQAICDPD